LVVAGVILEAVLLMVLFLVMFFSPPDEEAQPEREESRAGATEELLRELGEIGRDYAAMAVQLETIAGTLNDLVERQDGMISGMRDSVEAAVNAVAPNPHLMNAMQSTTTALEKFSERVDVLGAHLQTLERQEVERLVRIELERILSRSVLDASKK
jgi:hypothetical protein